MSLESIYDILTGLEKIAQVTDLELEESKGPDLAKLSNGGGMHVKLENISFSYPNYYKPTLRNVSLDIKSGKRLAITGENGSGKTTLLQLLAGFYDINSGNLLYDEYPKKNLNQERLRSAIGFNFTDEELFDGTIEENITMGREGIGLEELSDVANHLYLTEFIKGLPDGYSTRLDPQGQKLPRSITQKMLLARAIIDSPRLLIMEAQLKNIDEFEEHAIIDYLVGPERPWTLITVTTSPYFMKKVDEVAFMRDGRVIEQAPYEQIMQLINNRK
jgi:ABC-type bacteriocin/lantibiotic exporter with double-glycine peptidase domain